jgi:hypothetical protein
MFPEPTIPKPPAAAAASKRPRAVSPPSAVPDGGEHDQGPPARRRTARPPGRGRDTTSRVRDTTSRVAAGRGPDTSTRVSVGRVRDTSSRGPSARGRRAAGTAEPAPSSDQADLLAVTPQRLRRALARSFLRYDIPGDLQAAVHAAMNVIEPVLQARDAEIRRLRRLLAAAIPGR